MTESVGIVLQGGIGNRLFQISFLYSYAKRFNKKFGYVSSNENPHSIINYSKTVYPFFKKISIENPIQLNEPSHFCLSYIDIPNQNKDCLFIGYFQCEKYFKEYKHELISLFQLPSVPLQIPERSVFIHVRRGDYVNNSIIKQVHYIDLEKYYIEAIKFIQSKNEISSINIISDDISYCKNQDFFLKMSNVTFIENLNELETLSLMSKCNVGGVCSNSSFSWWGSYLNKSSDKMIIFPSIWFNDKRHQSFPNDIYYEGSYVMNIDNYEISKV
jgi:hypothetical protein